MDSKISFLKEVIKLCWVPELSVDLDNTPLESEYFEDYRKTLEVQLQFIFDFILYDGEVLLSKEYNEDVLEIKGSLLMLTAEVTAHNTLYKIKNQQFLGLFNDFIDNGFYMILDSEVEEFMLKNYTQYLKEDAWKRHIGAVHGYSRFLELRVARGCKLPSKWMNFSVSFGLMIKDCHLPAYKELSTRVFQIIISHSDPKELKDLNIPGVLFDSLLKSVKLVDSIDGTYDIWKCLCDCVDFNEDINAFEWCVIDEMMENLLGSLKNATDSKKVLCLLSFIPKILIRSSVNRKEIEDFIDRDYDSLSNEEWQTLRSMCSLINSTATFRWALYILKLFVAESHRLLASADMCEKMLQRFHICYLTCLYPIAVEVMNLNLLKFFEQYPDILMEAIALHKDTHRIRELVQQIYMTFTTHLGNSDLENVNKDFQPYHKAFNQFIETPSKE